MKQISIIKSREHQVHDNRTKQFEMECDKASQSGAVSQRACVFCGSRVVLYPVADAVHLVHGPIGCASYTWDIRGALSSGPELHRLSFSTDLRENDIIYGGVEKLEKSLHELIEKYDPKAAFVYSTCIIGIIGDDVEAVCKRVESKVGIPVIPVHSEGFRGTKKDGYKAACDALFRLMEKGPTQVSQLSPTINIMGEFNLAGEAWMIKEYYEKIGINVGATMTGDGRVEAIQTAQNAHLNVVQCSGSMLQLAKMMKEKYGVPFIRVSYFGIEDTSKALYDVASFFKREDLMKNAKALVAEEIKDLYPMLLRYREELKGKKAAVYVGGAFKAFSLVAALRSLGMEMVLAGSQTGNAEDYKRLQEITGENCVILDDSNPLELSKFTMEKGADLFIGGVKERPIAMKLGIGFCDHNHERKQALAGFEGMKNFANEVYASTLSPVWDHFRKKAFYE